MQAGIAVDAPAGERAGGLLDVALGEMAFAQREELHHFTREILVGLTLATLRAVEIDQHRGILGRGVQHRGEIADCMRAQRHVLRIHQAREAHLLLARHEMVVPEQRHPLGQRRGRGQHFPHPPRAQFQAVPHLLLPKSAALRFAGGVATRCPQWTAVERPGWRGRERRRLRGSQEPVDGLLSGQDRERAHLGFGGAETGPREQVPRVVKAHRRRRGVRRDAGNARRCSVCGEHPQ